MDTRTTAFRRYCNGSFRAASFLLLTLAAGCSSQHAQYPQGWAPPVTAAPVADQAQEACPNIAGRYSNGGTLAPGTPPELCKSATHDKFRIIGDWFCETSLGLNIGGMDASGSWIELRQPDDDTLVIIAGDSTLDPKELHRSKGDFDCTTGGLTRHLRASLTSVGYDEGDENTATKAYNAFAMVELAFVATGGVQTLKRTFSRATDGSLIMHVERGTHGLMFAIPINYDHSTYVSWPVDASASVAPEPTSAPPSTRVARVRPFREHVFATTWLVAVDGQEISNDELLQRLEHGSGATEFWDVTQAVEPGPHWVEWYPWNRREARYGSVVTLQAGHVYRLAEAPPDCARPSANSAGTSGGPLLWRNVLVEDLTPGGAAVKTSVRALCGVGMKRCQQNSDCGDQQCIHVQQSQWGFCGTEPAQ
jgi:hypothetical protein